MSILISFFPRNKWGQGMVARWWAFIVLIAVFAWGSYSSFQILYTYIGWQTEIPNPGIELPEESRIAEYEVIISADDAEAIKELSKFDKTDDGSYLINESADYILKEGYGFDPVTKEQRNGSGIAWAALVAFGIFMLFFLLSWRVVHGRKGSEVLLETEHELRKVVWPSKQRVFNS
ncbi:MAG: hypothetical protein K8S87_06865 [Planctomycetes bacterium]|nr:hypothetical protein [Planctomycetota bacterium]